MEEILNQILYGSMLGSRNIVESLIDELKKDSATVPIVKNFMAFLHSKDEKNVEQLKEKLALFSKNDTFSRKHPSGANQLLATAKQGVVPIR